MPDVYDDEDGKGEGREGHLGDAGWDGGVLVPRRGVLTPEEIGKPQ